MRNGPGGLTWRVVSVLWLTEPLVPVTCRMYVPVEASGVVVKLMGELASPPAGGVTVCGSVTAIPVGAFPTHEAEKITGELKLPREFTVTEVPPLSPGIVETVSEVGVTEKSGMNAGVAALITGARTVGWPAIATSISVEWETTPFDAVTRSV